MNPNANTDKTQKDEARHFSITLDTIQDLEFRVKFSGTGLPDLVIDEPPPAGHDKGPNPSRLLAGAVGGCLSASLLFCAQKLRLGMKGLHADVKVTHTRNEKGRLRIGKIDVDITPHIDEPDEQKLRRCLELFEDYCVVTQSVRQGLEVTVKVL